METRIKLETQGRSPVEIKELNLDNCPSTQITGLTDEYCNLESLSLINVGLTTLEGFPKLPNLKKLELSDNCISGDLNWLHGSPKLTHLNLSGNKIKDIKALMPLGELKKLKNLYWNCKGTSDQDYRDEIFGFISSLKYLDGYDKNNKEAGDSEVEIDEENATTASSGFSFGGITTMPDGISLYDHQEVTLAKSKIGSTGIIEPTFGPASEKTVLFSSLPSPSTSVFTGGTGIATGSNSFIRKTRRARRIRRRSTECNIREYSPTYLESPITKEKELYAEDYAANRKVATVFAPATDCTHLVTCLPVASTSRFTFSNTTNSKRSFGLIGKRSSSDIASSTSGTTTKFNSVTGCDEMMKGGVITSISTKFQVITAMKEYANKSFEELRVEDYAANRKGTPVFAPATDCTDLVTCLPPASTGFTFSNTTKSKPSVGAIGKTDIAILQKHFKDLLLSGDDHDVTIKIKNHEYKAHKSILRARSPVFSAMFKHQMKENVDNSISIEDCDAEDFGKFLQYIYTGEVENLSPSSSLNLYYAGDKYQVSGLKETCVNFLKFTLSTASICDVITLATKHNETDLLQCAISFFSEHLEEILFTVDWQRFLAENPIQANELYIKAVKTSYKKIS